MPSALALAALAFGWQSPPCQACPLQWCKKWPCSIALLEVVEVDKVTSTPHLSHREHSMVLRWSLMPSGGTACFIFWRQNSSLSCPRPSIWYHASKPSISQSQQIVDKKRLSALQHVLPANTLINDRRKHVQTKCSPVVFLTLHTSNVALQCHVQSYSTLVITGCHWFKTLIRPNSGNLRSCFGQALPSHCHASFSWSLFSVATSRPHSSWKLKSRQDDSAQSTSQKSNHVWLD